MPRKLPLHVERNRVKGRDYYSFRIGKGPRTPLPAYGTEEFNKAYAEVLAGNLPSKRTRRTAEKPGSIAALITSYKRSDAYQNLRATSKLGYNSRLDMLRKQHGHRAVAGLTKERIEILAESGASTHSIMAVLGHKTLAEAERYTRDADKRKLASAGIAVFRQPNANKHSQTASKRLGKIGNKKGKSR